MKRFAILLICAGLVISGCRSIPPGHDPNGPGNSENAPGHNKYKKGDDGPGNSENAPGQKKKQGY